MKEFIEYNYDLRCDDLAILNNLLYFKHLDKFYIISNFNRDEVEFEKVLNYLISNNLKSLKVVMNKKGSYISEFNGKKYVVMESDCENEIIDFPICIGGLINENNYWNEIWENRVVQLEKHKSELSLNKDIFYILNYYIGLIEICIYNYNLLIKKYGQKNGLSIQHNRIEFPIYSFSYYNPVNYLFDFEFRDFAEYLKMRFFYSDFSTDEAISVIDNYNFDNFSINMFFVRLIYPTYFLELYDIQNKNNVYSDLFYDLLKKSSQYENFILKLITAMSSKYEIIIKYPFIYQR
ncbi:spore coat protein cotS [Clostridium sp. CAG:533]|nr:spore coat protein cotS [Clostridium sp. CAG:533]